MDKLAPQRDRLEDGSDEVPHMDVDETRAFTYPTHDATRNSPFCHGGAWVSLGQPGVLVPIVALFGQTGTDVAPPWAMQLNGRPGATLNRTLLLMIGNAPDGM